MANDRDDSKNPLIPSHEVIRHAIGVRSELAGCAASLRDAAKELDGYAAGLDETVDVTAIRLASLGVNTCAVRGTFAILTARGIGDRLALAGSILELKQ